MYFKYNEHIYEQMYDLWTHFVNEQIYEPIL